MILFNLPTRKRAGLAGGVLLLIAVVGWGEISKLPLKFRQVALLFQGDDHSHGHGHSHGHRHSHSVAGHSHNGEKRTLVKVSLPETLRRDHQLTFTAVQARLITEDEQELAIPRAALLQDGKVQIFWRRDPSNPERVIRTVADLGPGEGEWVTVYSGIGEGEEVLVGEAESVARATGQTVKH